MAKKRTHEEYLQELQNKNIIYTPLEEYQGANVAILHGCPNGHQWPASPSHILRDSGCPMCSFNKKRKSQEEYLEELKNKKISHRPLEPYKNNRTPILHECSNGHVWRIRPFQVLNGARCKDCLLRHPLKKTHEQYLEELFEKELDFEPLEEYQDTVTKILHRCIEGHEWFVAPRKILDGRGCPVCASTGFKKDKPGVLYYLKIQDDERTFYKIGITNRTAKERFSAKDKEKITVIFEKTYEKGEKALEQEQNILREFADYRVHEPGLLVSGGNTELFTEDVLQLDPESSQAQHIHQSSARR